MIINHNKRGYDELTIMLIW